MKNRLYGFVNKINKAVDSVTKALENSGSGNKQQDNGGSIIDRLPMGDSKKAQRSVPVIKNVSKPTPVVTENVKKPEPPVVTETIIYSMYVCPECRKVFKVKGNDKKVKCSHCEGVHLKDLHIEEIVWKTYEKDQRDKIISNLLDEEEFEEAFEEVVEENLQGSLHEPSKFFDENGEFIDRPVYVKADYVDNREINNNKNNSVSNSNTFFFEEEAKSSTDSFFSGYDNFNNLGSMPPKKEKTYSPPTYTVERNVRRTSGSKPVSAMVALVMVGVVYFAGSSLFGKNSKQNENITNEATTKAYSSETATKPIETKPDSNNNTAKNNSDPTNYEKDYASEVKVTATPKPVQTNTNSKKSTNNTRQAEDRIVVPKTEDTQGNLVWIPTNGGKKYHSRSSCSGMKNPDSVSVEYAEAHGYTPCKKCY